MPQCTPPSTAIRKKERKRERREVHSTECALDENVLNEKQNKADSGCQL
jgi:hypothetical protein